jgi:succinate dehydrogenase / fumarate reductase, cytochrome b subunit
VPLTRLPHRRKSSPQNKNPGFRTSRARRSAAAQARMSDMSNGSRPLSPHLQIYRPQITTVLSISHRITGIVLSVGAIVLVWWLLAAAGGPESYARAAGFLGSFFGLLFLFAWTYALWFHFCAGIRHLVWDIGYGLELPQVYLGGWIVVGASVGLTILTWIVALIVW